MMGNKGNVTPVELVLVLHLPLIPREHSEFLYRRVAKRTTTICEVLHLGCFRITETISLKAFTCGPLGLLPSGDWEPSRFGNLVASCLSGCFSKPQ